MKISNKGVDLIKQFEGCRLSAYHDSVGIPTIGYGHTKNVKMGQTITQAQAIEFLLQDLATYERAVNVYTPLYNWTQNEFDALVSFTFNCGAGNFKKLIANGSRSKAEISNAFLSFNKARINGVLTVLAGLTRRRKAEKELFDSGAINILVIKLGARGEAVKDAQRLLNAKGYDCGAVDGIFGKKTDAAVRLFQNANGLIVDGIIGEKTWKALKSNK